MASLLASARRSGVRELHVERALPLQSVLGEVAERRELAAQVLNGDRARVAIEQRSSEGVGQPWIGPTRSCIRRSTRPPRRRGRGAPRPRPRERSVLEPASSAVDAKRSSGATAITITATPDRGLGKPLIRF